MVPRGPLGGRAMAFGGDLIAPSTTRLTMLGNVGGPELLIVLVLSAIAWGLPVATLIWALVTLARLRRGQDQILGHLAALRAALDARP